MADDIEDQGETVTFTDGDPVEGANKVKVGGKSPGGVRKLLNDGLTATITDDGDSLIREWDSNHNHVATRSKTQYQPFKW